MKCTNCGADIGPGLKFCTSCGSPAVRAACAKCGAEMAPGLRFCTACGTPVGVAAAPTYEPPSRRVPPTHQPQQPPVYAPAQRGYEPARGSAGRSSAPFWICFALLALLGGVFYWLGSVSVVGWIVLAVCLAGLFLIRGALVARGTALTLGAFVVSLVVLFLALGSTAPSSGGTQSAGGGTGTAPGPSGASTAPTGAARPATAATPVRLSGAPPDMLKPLIAALGKAPGKADYSVTQDGDSSYALLVLNVSGPTVQLPNWMGDTSWTGTFSFYATEARSKSSFQGQLKTTREDSGFQDAEKVFLPREEKPLGRGDEGYSWTRAWKDQPQASMRQYVVRQGMAVFYVQTQGDSKSPLAPGDGIEAIIAEIKKIDTRALLAAAPGSKVATAAPTAQPAAPARTATPAPARPTSTSVPAAGPKVAAAAFGLGQTPDMKIVSQTDTFKPDTPEIFLSLETSGVKGDTTVDVVWVYVGTGDSVKGPTQRINADARVGFSLTRPTAGWPAGQYRVGVFLNGVEVAAPGFTVQK